MKPKIVLILGYPRSGTTLLGEVIGQHEKIIHIGEAERLYNLKSISKDFFPNKKCSCGEYVYECDFWKDTFAEIKENIENKFEIPSAAELNSIKEYKIKRGNYQSKESKIFTEIKKNLYGNKTEKGLILDTSKELWYAEFLDSTNLFDISYIHLIRDVKGIVFSRQKKLKTKNRKNNKVKLNRKYLIYDTIRWNYLNSKIRKFLLNKNSIEVTYENFIKNPWDSMNRIGVIVGIGLDGGKIINSEKEFYMNDNHLIHGNRFRFQRGIVKLKLDTRYKKEMKKFDLNLIDWLSWFKLRKN